ncbi:MAG: tetratricopeptide repeat protein [Bdellovibrionaceae bacterium]|nr:tetratricopeptide repeat protein [Pseudobdellovibrionaceae bacterium]
MRNLKLLLAFCFAIVTASSEARTTRKVTQGRTSVGIKDTSLRQQLSNALALAQSGQYQPAAQALFNLVKRPEVQSERPQIKYILGKMLVAMGYSQVAAYQFVDVIRSDSNKYLKKSIEELSIVADSLGDDTLLNYAVSKVDVNDFPDKNKDMIYFRIGEIKLKNKNFEDAVQAFNRVNVGSPYNNQALYLKALAYLELKKPDPAVSIFQQLLEHRKGSGATDTNRVSALIGIARALYQKQDWDSSIEAYSVVPRDSFYWHDALFEQSWAMLRGARFRSALSNFQSLHSAYYEDFYIPESLLLRAIVYLYICKYDEMEKVLSLYNSIYEPVRLKISQFINSNPEPANFYMEFEKVIGAKQKDNNTTYKIPYMVLRSIREEGDVKRSLSYLKRVQDEKNKIETSGSFRVSGLGQYSIRVLNTRIKNTKILIGEMVKVHLQNMNDELKDLSEQASFINYERLSSKKDSAKKKIAGKDLPQMIDSGVDREFYVQNGYEFYPFKGEFWLDEVGNYHYLGTQSCE